MLKTFAHCKTLRHNFLRHCGSMTWEALALLTDRTESNERVLRLDLYVQCAVAHLIHHYQRDTDLSDRKKHAVHP